MKKILFSLYILLFISQLTSCSSDNTSSSLTPVKLIMTDLSVRFYDVDRTSLGLNFTGILSNSYRKILYREKGSNGSYKSVDLLNNGNEITGLSSGTAYEFRIEVSNSTSKLQSDPYYVTTHSVDFNYDDFFYDSSGSYKLGYFYKDMAYSAIDYDHIITANGLENFSKADVYLVNKDKTDSIIIPSVVVDKTLKFTIPHDFLSQEPRESYKQVYVGVKIKDDYQYLASSGYYSLERSDDTPLLFHVNNTQPYLKSIEFFTDNVNIGACPVSTQFLLRGEFYDTPGSNNYNWSPAETYFIVFNEDGSLYRSISDQNLDSDICSMLDVDSKPSSNLTLHSARSAFIAMPFPSGKYKGKMLFIFKNPDRITETNLVEFEVK